MNRILLPLAMLTLVAGCGRAVIEAPESAQNKKASSAHAPATAAETAAAQAEIDAALADASTARKPGDYVAFRFSGSFRKTPVTLTERVIAREGDTIVVDVTMDDGTAKRELRLRIDDGKEHKNQILSVALLAGGKEKPTTIEAYDAMLAGAVLSADSNDAVLGSETVKVALGKDTIDAKSTSYRVRVGKKHATLKTLESPAFAWGDLGGQITTDGGKVLYKAEVVDAGHVENAAPAVATDE